MFTNLIVLLTAGLILFDQAGWIEGVSYIWLTVMFVGWGFLKTAYDLGVKKKQEEEMKTLIKGAFDKFIFAMGSATDSKNSEKH